VALLNDEWRVQLGGLIKLLKIDLLFGSSLPGVNLHQLHGGIALIIVCRKNAGFFVGYNNLSRNAINSIGTRLCHSPGFGST